MTKHETAEAALAVLKEIDAGTVKVFLAHGAQDTFCNNVDYMTDNGWKFTVFIDCSEWDYLDSMTAPTGERLDYNEIDLFPVDEWRPEHEEHWLEAKVMQ